MRREYSAVELDDIFLQVITLYDFLFAGTHQGYHQAIFRKPNLRIITLLREAEQKYRDVVEKQLAEVNATFKSFEAGADGDGQGGSGKVAKVISRELHKQIIFEEDLKQALGTSKVSTDSTPKRTPSASYPIAAAVGKIGGAFNSLARSLISFAYLRKGNLCCVGIGCKSNEQSNGSDDGGIRVGALDSRQSEQRPIGQSLLQAESRGRL